MYNLESGDLRGWNFKLVLLGGEVVARETVEFCSCSVIKWYKFIVKSVIKTISHRVFCSILTVDFSCV